MEERSSQRAGSLFFEMMTGLGGWYVEQGSPSWPRRGLAPALWELGRAAEQRGRLLQSRTMEIKTGLRWGT